MMFEIKRIFWVLASHIVFFLPKISFVKTKIQRVAVLIELLGAEKNYLTVLNQNHHEKMFLTLITCKSVGMRRM